MQAVEELVSAIQRRDFEGVRRVVAPGAVMRALLPDGVIELAGADAILERLRHWFDGALEWEVLDARTGVVGDRPWGGYLIRLVRPSDPTSVRVIEQRMFCSIEEGVVASIDLLCSGFRREGGEASGAEPATHRFDAGDLGCADGLAAAFRRRIADVGLGELLMVETRDPAAKEDLPSLARLMGHRVRSVEAHDDGRLTITVERGR